ncbi:MAG TPA: superoxide dismutase [Ni] [Sedimentisphaerales bacterium]|nr:superoxide dismutase [Ni] [Sedimentisphaerales bacterium]
MAEQVTKKFALAAVAPAVAILATVVYSHCQIPCGIYGDPARFDMIAENITTIEKSMKLITELSAKEKPDMNQIVRWVQNKEKHADDTSHIITYYFMAQRIKPVDETDTEDYQKYVKKLTLLHQMLVYTMKAKQTTDLSNVEKLRALLAEFRTAYFGESGH